VKALAFSEPGSMLLRSDTASANSMKVNEECVESFVSRDSFEALSKSLGAAMPSSSSFSMRLPWY
jgi:hypothetical protein